MLCWPLALPVQWSYSVRSFFLLTPHCCLRSAFPDGKVEEEGEDRVLEARRIWRWEVQGCVPLAQASLVFRGPCPPTSSLHSTHPEPWPRFRHTR